uniref:Protein kinase domain-containing protein n=1 Tax=Ascaris lumbricoides TaxID=6252 RepID=A0A9J2PM66_ASCLU
MELRISLDVRVHRFQQNAFNLNGSLVDWERFYPYADTDKKVGDEKTSELLIERISDEVSNGCTPPNILLGSRNLTMHLMAIARAAANDEGPVELSNGRIVGRRWKIIEKLGEGGCGSVYKVQDIQTLAKAALKAESNFVPGGSVLKLEVQVLRRLEGRRYIAQLYSYMVMTLFGHSLNCLLKKCGQCSISTQVRVGINILYGIKQYSYMVMTLFGHSLNCLLKKCGQCSISTQVRVGINILYGIKQLHEVGFIHRDVKPANLAVGRRGKEMRIIHILDFGLSREYILSSGGTVKLRVPRTKVLFR